MDIMEMVPLDKTEKNYCLFFTSYSMYRYLRLTKKVSMVKMKNSSEKLPLVVYLVNYIWEKNQLF